ncbi:MAG: hypothetical protein ACKOYM_00595, partial [Actinomycetes bacterium]
HLAVDAARGRDDLRHRAAVAVLTLEVELEAERTACLHRNIDDDPTIRSARDRLAAAEAALSTFESNFGPDSIDAATRAAIEAAHDEVDRLRGKRRAEAALAAAQEAEADLLAAHGFASYLDYTIGNATFGVGRLAAGGIEHARTERAEAAAALSAAIEAFSNRIDEVELRGEELEAIAIELAGATSGEHVAAIVERLPAVTGDPESWSDYAQRAAEATRGARGDRDRLVAAETEIGEVATAIADLEHLAEMARSAVATAEIHLVGLWAEVDTETANARTAHTQRTLAEEAAATASTELDRRRAGSIDLADDLVDAILGYVGADPHRSLVLDDAMADFPAEVTGTVLATIRTLRTESDVLYVTCDESTLAWAETNGVRGHITPWWETAAAVVAGESPAGETLPPA